MSSLERRSLFFVTLDPLHVGSGERSLGRVDLPIVRDVATKVPKVPGTSLSGLARSNAALHYGKPGCAGQGSRDRTGEGGHCGRNTCPICYTFGHLRTRSGSDSDIATYAGVVRFHDAHLLFCPVPSSLGPVWLTTPERLEEAGFTLGEHPGNEAVLTTFKVPAAGLDLGWLLLPVKGRATIQPPALEGKNFDPQYWRSISDHTAVVDEPLYSPIVNANLEVRTSVSIDPLTGAASHGALFTYEAIPRLSWLYTQVVRDPYRSDTFPAVDKKATNGTDNTGEPLDSTWNSPLDVVRSGLRLADTLGMGGMGTRGFGRVKLVWEAPL